MTSRCSIGLELPPSAWVGNSLLGTTRKLIAGGLPDDAFTAMEGDDKRVCTQLKKRNKAEREGFSQGDLLGGITRGGAANLAAITAEARSLDTTRDFRIGST